MKSAIYIFIILATFSLRGQAGELIELSGKSSKRVYSKLKQVFSPSCIESNTCVFEHIDGTCTKMKAAMYTTYSCNLTYIKDGEFFQGTLLSRNAKKMKKYLDKYIAETCSDILVKVCMTNFSNLTCEKDKNKYSCYLEQQED